MSSIEEKLPGLVFHLHDSSYRHGDGVVLGQVVLTCDVPDEETWKAVVDIFEKGHRMLSGELQEEYVSMMKTEIERLEGQLKQRDEQARVQEERHRVDIQELQKYKDALGDLGRRLREG